MGCSLPNPKCHTPPLFCMCIFAPNHVVTKSHCWYFVSQLKKVKKSSRKIVCRGQVFEKYPLWVRSLGIWLSYDSPGGTHNMYQEYRDLTNRKQHHPVIPRHGGLPPCPRPLNPDHKGGGDSDQLVLVWQSSSSMTPRSSSHCPTRSFIVSTSHASPPRCQHLLSEAGPLCPLVCPNTLLGKTGCSGKKKI